MYWKFGSWTKDNGNYGAGRAPNGNNPTVKMKKGLLFLLLVGAVPAKGTSNPDADSIIGAYRWIEERTVMQRYEDSLRLSQKLWGGMPACTFGSPELPLEQNRILVLRADKTASLQVEGGPYAGIQELGEWRQDNDTINVIKDRKIVRKFLWSNYPEQRLTEMARMWQAPEAEDTAPFFLLMHNTYYRKIKNGQKNENSGTI